MKKKYEDFIKILEDGYLIDVKFDDSIIINNEDDSWNEWCVAIKESDVDSSLILIEVKVDFSYSDRNNFFKKTKAHKKLEKSLKIR